MSHIYQEDVYVFQKDDVCVSAKFIGHEFLALSKPSGMATTYSRKPSLLAHMKSFYSTYAPAHRLDVDTSGIILGGITPEGRSFLPELFRERSISKLYLATVQGSLPEGSSGLIDGPIDSPKNSLKSSVSKNGKPSLTEYQCLVSENNKSLVAFLIHSGRRHQIRVHSAQLGYPILGDKFYGDMSSADRLMLHCSGVSFIYEDQMTLMDQPPWVSDSLWEDIFPLLVDSVLNNSFD